MPTFDELRLRLAHAKYRRAILLNLVEYLDENFCPSGGQPPKKTLLTDEKQPVPVELFEAVASDTLTAEVEQLDQEIGQILGSSLGAKPAKPEKPEKPEKKGKKVTA